MSAKETKKSSNEKKPTLFVRNATIKDIAAIKKLSEKVYINNGYVSSQLRGQIQSFPEGQFVAIFNDEVVGYAATFIVEEKTAFSKHTWKSITGNGYASRHNKDGNILYGMEVMVSPENRGLRIGQRLYNARKKLCGDLRLKGIVFGSRMPGLENKFKKKSVNDAEDYLNQVKENKIKDKVVSFQMRNDFQVHGILKDYLPSDKNSMGQAAHMVWWNPKAGINPLTGKKHSRGRVAETVRVACIQYQQRRLSSFEEFGKNVEYFVDVVADYKADFVLFPELFTLQLLSIENKHIPVGKAIAELTKYTEQLKNLLSKLAVSYNINIIGGSHPTLDDDGDIINVCYVCLRDGSIHRQEKIHPTPNESYWWNIEGGDTVKTIMTDCGPIGVMICYDSEFPEIARHLVDQGAQILFVPFCTDERQSYLRVRYCAQARAIENQVYVAIAGNVGNLPGVENMDIQYAQSAIFTPCDFSFSRDGIAADTTPNVEMVALADLNLEILQNSRVNGTVQNLKDRRFDLYSINWHEQETDKN